MKNIKKRNIINHYFRKRRFACFVNTSLTPTTPPVCKAGLCVTLLFTDVTYGNKWQITFKYNIRYLKSSTFKTIHILITDY